MIGEGSEGGTVAAGGEVLEGADADMAMGHAGQDGTGHPALAVDHLTGADGSEGAGGGDAESGHGFAYQIFAQDGAEPGAAIAGAAVGGGAGAFELDVAADAVVAHDFAQEDGAPIAELRVPVAELMAGIGLCQWRGA